MFTRNSSRTSPCSFTDSHDSLRADFFLSRWRYALTALVFCAYFSCQAAVAQNGAVRDFDAREGTNGWIAHTETGRVFASVEPTNEVVEYDLQGKEVSAFPVGALPDQMLIKNDKLVVACRKSASFTVIDLKTNKVLGSVDLSGNGPYSLFCSQAENSYVYGLCNTGDAWWDGEVFQVDIDALKIRKQVKIQNWGQSHALHVAMTPDGKWIVPDARGASSPSGADLMMVDEEKCTFVQIRDHHKSFGPIAAGPSNRYWTLGNALYPLDLTKSIRTFSGSPVTIHPALDLVASYKDGSIVFDSFSDAKQIKSVKVGVADEKEEDPRSRIRNRNTAKYGDGMMMQFDLKRNKLIYGSKSAWSVIDLDELGIDAKPILMISATTNPTVSFGDTLELPLKTTNPTLTDTKFELTSGPDNASIENGKLVWKPTEDQIGPTDIVIQATNAELKDSINLEVNVKSRKTTVDFAIQKMEVSPDGTRAIVWGIKAPEKGHSIHHSNGSAKEIAVIDLENQKVVIQKTMSAGILAAFVDDTYAYIAPASGNLFYRFDRDTLANSQRTFLDAAVRRFVYLPGDKIGVFSQASHNQQLLIYDRKTLKSDKKMLPDQYSHHQAPTVQRVAGDRLQIRDRIVDFESGELICLTSQGGIPVLVNPGSSMDQRAMMSMMNMRGTSFNVFGRAFTGNALVRSSGSQITTINTGGTVSCFDPLAFSVRVEQKSVGRSRINKYFLETRNIVDGTIINSKVVDVYRNMTSNHYSGNLTIGFTPLSDNVVFALGSDIYRIPVSESSKENAPMPLHIPWPKLEMLDVAKTHEIKIPAKGGTGEIEYALRSEYPGLTLDSKTGTISVDLPKIWNKYVAAQSSSSSFMRSRSQNTKLAPQQYELATGKPVPEGVTPFLLPLSISASDDEGQEATMLCYAIVNGSTEELTKLQRERELAMEKQRAEMIARNEQAAREREVAMLEAQKVREAEKIKGNEATEKRIDELDRRLRRIEAALDTVLEKLDNLEKE